MDGLSCRPTFPAESKWFADEVKKKKYTVSNDTLLADNRSRPKKYVRSANANKNEYHTKDVSRPKNKKA